MLRINFYGFSNKELRELANKTIAIAREAQHPDVISNPLLSIIETNFQAFDLGVANPDSTDVNCKIADADWLRDNHYSGLVSILKGLCAFADTEKGKLAETIVKIFDNTGNISGLNYGEENVVLESLIQQLNLPENVDLINKIGLTEEVAVLKKSQHDFMKLYKKHVSSKSELLHQSSASSLRHELQDSLSNFYAYISALSTYTPWKEIYSEIVETVRNSTKEIVKLNNASSTNIFVFG